MRLRNLVLGACVAAVGCGTAAAQTAVKIGVLTDISGPLADASGQGSILAARLAIQDFKPQDHGLRVELVSADHQDKPDVALSIARKWIDTDGVDVIVDVPASSVALAVSDLVRAKDKILLVSGSGTSELTGRACSPNTIQWTYDTWALAHGVASALVKQGFSTWYFITADYAFGKALQVDASQAVEEAGGRVLGASPTAFPTTDFSSSLLAASTSGTKVIAFANGGTDTINAVKQAGEFGLPVPGQKVAALQLSVTNLHAIGLDNAQGLVFLTASYWDLNEGTRAFARRYAAELDGAEPGDIPMGVYSSVLHYLKAVAALGDKRTAQVMVQMRATPTDDPLFGVGQIRADGRTIHNMYLMEAKTKAASKGPWDLLTVLATVPAAVAFRPLDQSGCPLVTRPALAPATQLPR